MGLGYWKNLIPERREQIPLGIRWSLYGTKKKTIYSYARARNIPTNRKWTRIQGKLYWFLLYQSEGRFPSSSIIITHKWWIFSVLPLRLHHMNGLVYLCKTTDANYLRWLRQMLTWFTVRFTCKGESTLLVPNYIISIAIILLINSKLERKAHFASSQLQSCWIWIFWCDFKSSKIMVIDKQPPIKQSSTKSTQY